MPGTSSPTGVYTRRRKPSRRIAACARARPCRRASAARSRCRRSQSAGVGDGVGQRPQVVAWRRRPAPRRGGRAAAACSARSWRRSRPCLRRRGPASRSAAACDGLGVPVGALHQAHPERACAPACPSATGAQVGGRESLQVGLDDDAGVEVGELGLARADRANSSQGEVLDVVVLHVEPDQRPCSRRTLEDRPQPALGRGPARRGGERRVMGGQRGRLDR